jgi:PAS domain S-box-containing protein
MDKELRILILEDVPADAELMERELRRGGNKFSSKRVDTKKAFLKELKDFAPDLILGDYNLPSFDGIAALAIVQEKHPDIPFIFVSGTIGEEMAIETLKKGATDYVLKNRLSRLVPAVNRTLREVEERAERKRAEEALRQSEEKYRLITASAKDGIFTLDMEGKITFVSPHWLSLTGYAEREIIGQHFTKVLPEEYWALTLKRFKDALSGKEIPLYEIEIHTKDGRIVPIEINVSSLLSPEGQIVGRIGLFRDITERKKLEQEKGNLEEQLRQSQKMEAIGCLAGGIAHDFNNLLTVIKGYSQLSLLKLKEDVPLRSNIEEIKRASERAADLTCQLLAFSRRQVMEMKVLDLNYLLRNLDKMLYRVIGEDIELVTGLADDLGRVKTDPGQIEQVIMNLAVNARDAMPKGGKLTIETANVDLDQAYTRAHVAVEPGPYVMISVSDTGVGMPPEIRDRVFEPFFTTKEKGKGTGLGLSTVYGIVKQSGGDLWVYSEPGKGTTFKIYLPRIDEPLEESREKVVREELPRGSESILIVEDDEGVRKLAVQFLQMQGYTVLEACQGKDALSVCEKHKKPIHLMVSDVVMPGMDGRELGKQLEVFYPGMKVLYMSGYTDNTIVHHGVLDRGMNYIKKPFTIDGLARKVREALDK